MSGIQFELKGMDTVLSALKALPADLKAKLLRAVNRKAAQITQREMIARAPQSRTAKTPGHTSYGLDLVDNIKISTSRKSPTGILVGPGSRGFYARFIEYGSFKSRPRKTKGRGDKIRQPAGRGQMPKAPFLEPAIDATASRVVDFAAKENGKIINKSLERRLRSLKK